jgi:hypothetical protein
MIGTKTMPACNGLGCLLRETCARYRETIDTSKEISFSITPVKYENGVPSCEFIITKPKTDGDKNGEIH